MGSPDGGSGRFLTRCRAKKRARASAALSNQPTPSGRRRWLVIAGPEGDAAGPFRLYRWSAVAGESPELLRELATPANTRPEEIITYPGTRDVQILLDSDDVPVGTSTCDDAPTADREFRDLIVPL